MISGNVAPLARFIMAMTSAFLLVRSAFGLPAGVLARAAFFAALAFFVGFRAPLGFAASGAGLLTFVHSDDVDQSIRCDADQIGAKRRKALSV
jgi:hypothetical protein